VEHLGPPKGALPERRQTEPLHETVALALRARGRPGLPREDRSDIDAGSDREGGAQCRLPVDVMVTPEVARVMALPQPRTATPRCA